MNADWIAGPDKVAELRRAFDQSFAEAPPLDVAALEDLLDVRFGPTAYALRVTEISGLFAGVKITPLPTAVPELLGIAGIRGSILPVYDLRVLLGYAVDARPRWLAVAAGAPVGLAFDRFEGHVRVRRDALMPQGPGETAMRHVREVVHREGLVRPVVSIPSVLEAVTSRVRRGAAEKE